MEDNIQIHKSRFTTAWKENHDIDTIRWSAQLPDLNPIENLWHQLKVAIERRSKKTKKYCRFIDSITGGMGWI